LRAGEIFPTHVVATRVCYSLAAMRTKSARKLTTEYQFNMSAQRALMRRPYSIHEMKQYLERRAEKKELIPPVIARLRELNYLDDARYALEYPRPALLSRVPPPSRPGPPPGTLPHRARATRPGRPGR